MYREYTRTRSGNMTSKLMFRGLYHNMKNKGRIAMLVGTILVCAIGLVLEIVGIIKFQAATTDKTIPVIILGAAFVLCVSGISLSASLSDAARYHCLCGTVGQVVRSKIIPISVCEEDLDPKEDCPELRPLDKKIRLASMLTAILEVVVAIIIAVVIIKL